MWQLLRHHRLEGQRSPIWTKNVLLGLVIVFFGFILLMMVISIGLMAQNLIERYFGKDDVIGIFTGLLLYYFIVDLAFRFLVQQLPTLSIQPYLTLPVSRHKLMHYPLLKSVFHFFNFLAVILVLPFYAGVIVPEQSWLFSLGWAITFISFVMLNNFLNFTLKKYFLKKPFNTMFILIAGGSLLFVDINHFLPVTDYFSAAWLAVAKFPLLQVFPLTFTGLAYYSAWVFMLRSSYSEELAGDKFSTGGFSFFNRFGETGELLALEIKMILRNKRPRSVLFFSFLFLAYGMIIYKESAANFQLILGGFILTSAFSINYGQFLFSWEGSYFDAFMVNKINHLNYVKSKYILFAFGSVTGFLLTLPYTIIDTRIAYFNAAMMLYNTGISSIILLFLSTNNRQSIDLSKSQFFNYQGSGATQFLMILPLMGIPLLIHLAFWIAGKSSYSIFFIGGAGLAGIVFSNHLLTMVAAKLKGCRYVMAHSFRKK
jgi:hypothetical protein